LNLIEYIECEFNAVSIVDVNDGRQFHVGILTHDGRRVELVADQVDDFSLDNMRLRNYIEEILIYDYLNIDEKSEDAIRGIFYLLQGRPLEKDDRIVFGEAINRMVTNIKSGEKILVEINSLYGGDMTFFARKIRIEAVTA
jgi:hypothetical protein